MALNRDVFLRDPAEVALLNNGVAAMTDAFTGEERRTLRFELEHFVCEGEYARGLVRILESYVGNMGQPEQPAAWISGFYGSGKSHMAKMLQYLWFDYTFPEDGATARGLARLPADVADLFQEISTLGKRHGGLHAASGTLGSGAGESARLALLGIVFRSAGFPGSFPQARFCMWLKKNFLYDRVRGEVEGAGRAFRKELNDLYVSPVIARALLHADPTFAADEREARGVLRDQFPPKPKDISSEEFVLAMQDALAPEGGMPCTVLILDEVQQYIGDDSSRSYAVQEVVEACSKRFGDRLLFVGTGQTALSGTPALQRLQGRFTVNVELSDSDVETVTRRVVLAKRADRLKDVERTLEANAGEIDRHLKETRIGPRSEDRAVLVEDYPLLPVRRRFWEHTLRAVDRAGTAGQLRTQLRIVYDAIRATADRPLGTVVPADFLFDEIAPNLLQSGVLLREIDEVIRRQDDGSEDGRLKGRLCALIFLIRKLPREPAADAGVRATPEMLADLLVKDLGKEGAVLRGRIPPLLDELAASGTLIKIDNEYSLQTRESSEWEHEFRAREARIRNDLTRLAGKRSQLLSAACQDAVAKMKFIHGKSKEPRRLLLHFGADPPAENSRDIPVWIRDGWGTEKKTVFADARAAGPDSPIVSVFIPKTQAPALSTWITVQDAASGTLEFKGVPATREGVEAKDAMRTRLLEAGNHLAALVKEIIDKAEVVQGGGNERLELGLAAKVQAAAEAALDRLFPSFRDADDDRWEQVIQRARQGAENPLEVIGFHDRTEKHPVAAAVLSFVGSGRKGKEVRAHFAEAPHGWPRDAVDAALVALCAQGHLSAAGDGVPYKSAALDQAKIPVAHFRAETATLATRDRVRLRGLYQAAGIPCKPGEEAGGAGAFLDRLLEAARGAGGDAPLPERPDTAHIARIQSLAGNEQLQAILEIQEELKANLDAWTSAKAVAEKRLPIYEALLKLLRYGEGQGFAGPIQEQLDAVRRDRRLLDAPDPLPDLLQAAVSGLRAALTAAEGAYTARYDQETGFLEGAEGWRRLDDEARSGILSATGLTRVSKGPSGTADEVLASLKRLTLEGWATKTAALPQQFADARAQADRLIEPRTQHIRLTSNTLRTEQEVRDWLSHTEAELLGRLKDGPIVVS